jgi:hypothetical protein
MTAPVQEREVQATAGAGLTAAEAAAFLALVQAQARIRQQLTATAIRSVVRILQAFTAWYDSDAITQMTRDILRVVQPAQRQAARVTDAYIAQALTRLRDRPVRPVGVVDITKLRTKLPQSVIEDLAHGRITPDLFDIGDMEDGANTDIDRDLESVLREQEPEWLNPADPYGRLADTWRYETIVKGASEADAIAKVVARAEAVVDTDIALAVRAQEIETARRRGVTFYRRVLHPELAESGLSCGLCIVASDRVYSVEKFKRELHDHCHCEMLPIENGVDPGLNINTADLESLYGAAGRLRDPDNPDARETGGGKRQGGALKRIRARLDEDGRVVDISKNQGGKVVRVAVTEHGELGPVLVNNTGNVRTVADFARTQSTDKRITRRANLESLERNLPRLLAAKVAGNGNDKAIQFHLKRIAELKRELASA